ncbi:ATP-grasp domain-containing protein [Aridibaculum aurantiacum]|uniref:ATP-grasp domain-containing protein n=1 Tax=Aridibaculum aurantiacum TaxID=2810307 RepID=UPI001A95CAB6|nr:ATP-grasp domain-containing protein [Aridibaculum aurantiacum]
MNKTIGVFYEHPEWFKPFFKTLDEKGLQYEKIHAGFHNFDPLKQPPYSVVINRVSSSSYLRGHGQAIFYSKAFIGYLEENGVRVINGSRATEIETSKALQLVLFKKLGVKFPKAVVVNHASQIVDAAKTIGFPLAVKPNIGGSGAGIIRFDSMEALEEAVESNSIQLGIDETALVQEFIPVRGGHINRVETLNGKFLYAIKVYTTGESFNLCPAEICQVPQQPQPQPVGEACVIEAVKKGLKVEAFTPPAEIIAAVESIVKEAKIDVGGIEYMIDDRTGDVLFYDINALSNFIADAVNVVGFDPFKNLVDFIEKLANENI